MRRILLAVALFGLAAPTAVAQDPAWVDPWVRADRQWLVPKAASDEHRERVRLRYADAQAWLDAQPEERRETLFRKVWSYHHTGNPGQPRPKLLAAIAAIDPPFAAVELLARQQIGTGLGLEPGPAQVAFTIGADGSASRLFVEFPPDYDAKGRQWPLLITMHGSGEPPAPRRDRLAALLRDRGWFVAAPLSTPNQMRGWGSTAVERSVVTSAWRRLADGCAIDPDRVILNGYSMGANATWEVGMLHRDRFAGLAADAGGPRYRCFPFLGNVAGLPIRANVGANEDGLLQQAVGEAVAFLGGALQGPVVHTVTPGVGHDEPQVWLEAMADWMADVRRDCYPRALCHHFAAVEQGRHHWVQALAVGPKAVDATTGRIPVRADPDPDKMRANYVAAGRTRSARIVARVDGQTIHVETRHVPKLAVYLSDRLCDLDQKVFVKVNGRTAWSGIPERSIAQMLDEIRATRDVGRVYAARIEVRGR